MFFEVAAVDRDGRNIAPTGQVWLFQGDLHGVDFGRENEAKKQTRKIKKCNRRPTAAMSHAKQIF